MKKSFKSKVSALLIVLTLSSSTLYAPRANSMVAIASWNPILMGVGLAITTGALIVGGGLGGASGAVLGNENWFTYAIAFLFGTIGAAGMIVLDGEGSQQLQFTPLNADQAAKLGIFPSEAQSFNQELDQVNVVASQVADELSRMPHPTLEDSKRIWESSRELISPETFSVMQKISAQLRRK